VVVDRRHRFDRLQREVERVGRNLSNGPPMSRGSSMFSRSTSRRFFRMPV
jgi:hypothetical protein